MASEKQQKCETIWTVARIADHLGVQRHRVEYVLDSSDDLQAGGPLGVDHLKPIRRGQSRLSNQPGSFVLPEA